jgi:hypothetical protein
MKPRYLALFALLAVPALAQLTPDQRVSDFRNLADVYARRYAAIDWKKSVLKFDVLNLAPWLERVRGAKSDLEFYDLMAEYVADLKDAHDQYILPSDFEATLGFTVDLYDGKALIDTIDRKRLSAKTYPFGIGDELVSVDDKTAAEWISIFRKYAGAGSSRAEERFAAKLITDRYQGYYPWAANIADAATVVLRRQGSALETYTLRWAKSGTPLVNLGPSASPLLHVAQPRVAQPRYREFLDGLRTFKLSVRTNIVGYGRLAPVFALPAGFVPRLGGMSYDSYYSGTYATEDGKWIGYLRVPDFEYLSMTVLDKEIKYFQENTDALVVDVMRNPGGDVCYAEELLSRLSVRDFQGASAEVRVTWWDIVGVNSALADAIAYSDDEAIDQLTLLQKEFTDAYQGRQGRTAAVPMCAAGTDRKAAANAYTKPVLVLVDEISASSADIFAAMVQDNQIAPLFGYRTMGAGAAPKGTTWACIAKGMPPSPARWLYGPSRL